jgi:adenylate cyclase
VDLIQVKGKSRPIEVFTVLAERNTGVIEPPWLADYEQAVKLYRQRRFKEAEQLLAKCLAQVPDDFLCQHYLERCRELILNPPDDSWDGVFVMKNK